MSGEKGFMLIDSRTGNYTQLPGLRNRVEEGYGLELRQALEQAPGSSQAFLIGDGVPLVKPLVLTLYLQADSEGEARFDLTRISSAALSATTLARLNGGLTAYRALLGVQSIPASPVQEIMGTLWSVRFVFLPKFAYWTDRQAETSTAFATASQSII